MIAQITEIKKKTSRYGGDLFVIFMKTSKGEIVYTYILPAKRNYVRWKKIMRVGIVLKGLKLLRGRKRLIDADSRFTTLTKK